MGIMINGLCKQFGKIVALNSVSLKINPGIHGLLGSNGAGKTTLMRILATILSFDSGEISWGDAINWNKPENVKGLLGYLPQQFGMYKHLKVKEALQYVTLGREFPLFNFIYSFEGTVLNPEQASYIIYRCIIIGGFAWYIGQMWIHPK